MQLVRVFILKSYNTSLMFRTLILLFAISFANWSLAQHHPSNLPTYDYKSWHFGFTLGVNNMDFKAIPVEKNSLNTNVLIIEPSASQGFNIGIVSNKRINNYLDARFVPTLSFGERKLNYTILENDTIRAKYVKNIESTIFDFPITLKYKSERLPGSWVNSRVYVVGGMRYSIDFASQKNKENNNQDIIIKLNQHDFLYTLGLGFDFYMQFFKFGVELQLAWGIPNMLYKETNIFTSNIDKLNSKIAWVTFTFE